MSELKYGVMLPVRGPSSLPSPKSWTQALDYQYNNLDLNTVKQTALKSEKLGYHSVWVVDHLSTHRRRQRLECWTTMTWLASITNKIRIGSLVLCPLYRHPSILAKMAATLDVISEGRLELGLGACATFNKTECDARGIKWVGPASRLRMLSETVEICKMLWSEEEASYNGQFYKLNNAVCEPKPVQKPHPPITIAGRGDRMLQLIAKYADKNNFGGPQELARKIRVLHGHCEAIGRDYDSIEKTITIGVVVKSSREEYLEDMRERFIADGSRGDFNDWLKRAEKYYVSGTPEDCVEQIQYYVEMGMNTFMIRFGDVPKVNDVRLFAKEVIPNIYP
jgi:alkanesulfonate monooxygenase SsuD/methylene tetrahydromethanopterin reductase-like flavin-dependent oxidoreductase (luciferase family)